MRKISKDISHAACRRHRKFSIGRLGYIARLTGPKLNTMISKMVICVNSMFAVTQRGLILV